MVQSPKIGITMRLENPTRRFYLGRDYSEALENFGAVPLHISLIPKKNYIRGLLEGLDGLLLPGSDSDVDPDYYGEEPHQNLKNVVPVKDETEFLVLEEAERTGLPILAICYGMQALNVWRGGSLVQDISTQLKKAVKHEQGIPLERNSHGLRTEKGSLISGLITKKDCRVNSHHHQAVARIGRFLKATAWAKDGVVECIEDTRKDRFVFGVQWHPELSWRTDDLSGKIFELFVEETRKRAFKRRKRNCQN
ncbi:MAG: gamma-glutamyl-gamma-aminobutyrate hydrolase family protein [Pyrinomonadaceae bacterium]